jgi:hypothetical protein
MSALRGKGGIAAFSKFEKLGSPFLPSSRVGLVLQPDFVIVVDAEWRVTPGVVAAKRGFEWVGLPPVVG